MRRSIPILAPTVLALACGSEHDGVAERADPEVIEQLEYEAPTAGEALDTDGEPPLADAPSPPRIEPPRDPIAVRIARQMLVLRSAPDHDAPIRGRIPLGEAFEVFAFVAGPECAGKGWGDLGDGAFACLEASRKTTDAIEPRALPEMRDGDLAPFFYAHVKNGQVARRWKNAKSWVANEPHLDVLEPEHDYAFVTRRRIQGELVLIDEKDRVVLERELTRYRPSRFAGRDLVDAPVPQDRLLAWTVTWPENPVLAQPAEAAPLARSIGYQEELLLVPTPTRNDDGVWFEIADGGWIHGRNLRRWRPTAPPADVADDELWIDVELDSQTLTVSRGPTPLFATLVSTGFKGPTPKGIFRISMKHALGSMRSRPDSDDPYTVEAVPFVQYFTGNFALHGAFWHYRFGHKISHGCVNLSPSDARHVFGMTTPRVRDGWISSYESDAQRGTTVRVRKGDEPVPDRRGPVQPLEG